MMNQQQYEQQQQAVVNERRAQIDALGQAILATATPGSPSPLPKSVKEILKELSMAVAEAEQVVSDHASGTVPMTNATLQSAGELLKEVHTTMDSLILHGLVSGR